MKVEFKSVAILTALAGLFFFFGNGIVSLTSPDEVFYAQTANEMASRGEWMTPILFGEPQFEKPIMVYWLLRVGYLIFGMNSFAARFFPAVFGTLGVIGVYFLSLQLFKQERKAFVSAVVLLSAGFYVALSRSVFTDMIFSIFILYSFLSFYIGYSQPKHKGTGIMMFFACSALAVLTKGPLGLIIPGSSIMLFLFLRRQMDVLLDKRILLGGALFCVIALPWYVLMSVKYGQVFLHEFFYNDHIRRLLEAEHSSADKWYFYPGSMVGCMFPWGIFVVAAMFRLFKKVRDLSSSELFLACWIVVTFAIFQVAHSKLTSYIFPLFPALGLVTGSYIYDLLVDPRKKNYFLRLALLTWIAFYLFLLGGSFGAIKYSYYLSSLRPVYVFAVIFLIWLCVTLILILRKKYFPTFYMLMCFVPVVLTIIPLVHKDIEPYISSRPATEFLLKNFKPDKDVPILCSKTFARATRFYTGFNVAVFGINTGNYFSPHPIPFLDSEEKFRDFLKPYPRMYAFLRNSSLRHLIQLSHHGITCRPLAQIGDQWVVVIENASER